MTKKQLIENKIRKIVREEIKRLNESEKSSIKGVKELRDGLTDDTIKSGYPWLLKANIKDAVIGIRGHSIIWYDGTWNDGVWRAGTWKNGNFNGGVWKYGDFQGGNFNDGSWKGGRYKGGSTRPENVR